MKLNIAVIGAGVSGLAAAWLLSKRHRVVLFERAPTPGGHAHTVDVDTAEGPISVDTGFIVYNERNYPNLTALFAHLGVATQPSEMSFSLSVDGGAYEYSGTGLGYFGQRRNLVSLGHWRLLGEIARFFREAGAKVRKVPDDMSLGMFLAAENYSNDFIQRHLLPMGAAIWSSSADAMLSYPARGFVEFYENHGLLQFRDRPAWRTVTGGSRAYVDRLLADGEVDLRCSTPIRSIRRHDRFVEVVDGNGITHPFDHVVLASHADEAAAMLTDADDHERQHLSRIRYQENRAVLHGDRRWMPCRRRLWSSWNYLKHGEGLDSGLCVTYWMNRLQSLPAGTDLFVTLNPTDDIHPKAVRGVYTYSHPVFTPEAHAARDALAAAQGRNRTWFAGAHFGHGFHEDGLQSGLAVAERLGGISRPWTHEARLDRIPPMGPLLEAAE